MHLILSVNDTALEKIAIDPARYKDRPYLKAVQKLLIIRHRSAIESLKNEPVCYLLLPSKM